MNIFYFLVRHTPFWALPVMMICSEFAYIFWLRDKKKNMRTCLWLNAICLIFVVYYYWAGGPEEAVSKFIGWLGDGREFITN